MTTARWATREELQGPSDERLLGPNADEAVRLIAQAKAMTPEDAAEMRMIMLTTYRGWRIDLGMRMDLVACKAFMASTRAQLEGSKAWCDSGVEDDGPTSEELASWRLSLLRLAARQSQPLVEETDGALEQAACATVCRPFISEEDYESLMRPWASVMGWL